MLNNKILLTLLILFSFLVSCIKSDDKILPGNDPNFAILANTSSELKRFNRKVEVFGIDIYANRKVEDDKLLHAANVMAQYLDNDENGIVDNPHIVDKMIKNRAFLVMWKKQSDLLLAFPNNRIGQDLGNDETRPEWHNNNRQGSFDASLEEVLHIITHSGYAYAYPDIFGENVNSYLANAMDLARGGRFESVPKSYPESAWYSYDDKTCDYSCMVTEYIYWGLTSLLGAQENRYDEIGHEWKLNTTELFSERDIVLYNLLTSPEFKFPSKLPDGNYRK